MRKSFFLSLIFFAISAVAFAQSSPEGSPCPNFAQPFCTDETPDGVSFPSGTNGNASAFLGTDGISCCHSTPAPAWYYMQISSPGNLLIYLYQTEFNDDTDTIDVDFVCWGPFEAQNQSDFVSKLCNNTYTLGTTSHGNHRPPNGIHNGNMGGYPDGGVVDCSWDGAGTEWCYIPNAREGQWYLLLILNYESTYYPPGYGYVHFDRVDAYSTATTNCNLLNTAGNNSPICEGETLELICTAPQAGAIYRWTLPGTSYGGPTQSDTFRIYNATPDMTGEWQMTMENISQHSNTAYTQVTVNSSPHPVMTSTDDFAVCAGDSIHLAVDSDEGATYTWRVKPVDSTQWKPLNAQNPYVTSITYPTENQNLVFYLKETLNECEGTSIDTVTVNPIPVIGITVDKTQLCYGESNNMTATGGTQYQWSTGATSASINVTPLATTDYSVNVKTDAQCEADTTFTIRVNPEIIFGYETSPSYCDKPTGSIAMQMQGGSGGFNFTCPDPHVLFTDTLAEQLLAGTYSVTATDAAGCSKTQNIEVPAVAGPSACFVFASSDDVHMSITNCTTGGNNNSYFWDFGDAVTSVDVNPEHEYADPGRYTVSMQVIDENQCMDSLKQDYLINGPVYFPNAFTPNGDGLNDIMQVVGRTIQVEDFLWVVYDRRGTQAFVSINPELGWDGKLSDGKPAPAGVYVYYLKYKDVNGNKFEKEGSFTLIR